MCEVTRSYIGGAEHSIMHLLFARFVGHFLYEQQIVPQPEPFDHLITQGMVLAATYMDKETGAYLHPEDVQYSDRKWVDKRTGREAVEKFLKMSKSKYNGIDPVDALQQYGSDVVRVAMLMQCPVSNSFIYSKHSMTSAQDVLGRIDRICAICKAKKNESGKKLNTNALNSAFNKILRDMELFDFHNVISGIIKMMNVLLQASFSPRYVDYVKEVLLFWEPFAPAKSERCWKELQAARCIGEKEVFEEQSWPTVSRNTNTMVIVQVNGKMKKTVTLESVDDVQNPELIAIVEKKPEMEGLINFVAKDIRVVRKGQRVVLNYIRCCVCHKQSSQHNRGRRFRGRADRAFQTASRGGCRSRPRDRACRRVSRRRCTNPRSSWAAAPRRTRSCSRGTARRSSPRHPRHSA